ncbi:MAG: efflux RND transporter periplasmic adaptor subunit [Planctomycetota bacterium]
MKKNDKIVAAAVVAVLVVGLIFYLSRGGGDETGAAAVQPESVRLADVTEGPIREEVKLTGEVKAIADVDLAPKVSGRLVSVEVEEGDYVSAAAPVAMLDRDVFEAAVREAEAAVQVARANAKMAQVVRENAGLEYERVKSLFEQGTVPESNRDDAQAAHSKAAAGVEVAAAAVLQAQAALERAKINLNESRLLAPFDGVVADRLLDVGSFVSPGTPILRLVSVDTVKVTAGAAERYLGDLEVGRTRVVVTVDSLPGRSFPGMLHFISPVIDAGTRTAEIEIRIPNKERLLKPGMYARVSLVTRRRDRAVLVPNDAVLGREGDYHVFVEDGGRVRRTQIDLDLRGAHFSEATAGLEGGEKVVISGAGNLLDGAQVVVGEEPVP